MPPGAQMGYWEGPGVWHGPLARYFSSAVLTCAGQEGIWAGRLAAWPLPHSWRPDTGGAEKVLCPVLRRTCGRGLPPGPVSRGTCAPPSGTTARRNLWGRCCRPFSPDWREQSRPAPSLQPEHGCRCWGFPARPVPEAAPRPLTPTASLRRGRAQHVAHRCPSLRCGLSEAWHGAPSGPEQEDRGAVSKPSRWALLTLPESQRGTPLQSRRSHRTRPRFWAALPASTLEKERGWQTPGPKLGKSLPGGRGEREPPATTPPSAGLGGRPLWAPAEPEGRARCGARGAGLLLGTKSMPAESWRRHRSRLLHRGTDPVIARAIIALFVFQHVTQSSKCSSSELPPLYYFHELIGEVTVTFCT